MTRILKIGPWGYNMSINNFYEVIGETLHTLKVRQIGSTERSTGFLSGYERPNTAKKFPGLDGKDQIYTVQKQKQPDGSIKLRAKCDLSHVYTLEEVQPGQEFYFNHCD